MNKRILLAIPVAALFASLALANCHLEIACVTVENCETGQVCVAGLCQDAPSGTGGAGSSSSTSTSTGSGSSSTASSGSSSSTAGSSSSG
jgi:hypothetical protein